MYVEQEQISMLVVLAQYTTLHFLFCSEEPRVYCNAYISAAHKIVQVLVVPSDYKTE